MTGSGADEGVRDRTMGGVTPVLTVDGRTIGSGRPGPFVTQALRAAYLDRTAAGDGRRLERPVVSRIAAGPVCRADDRRDADAVVGGSADSQAGHTGHGGADPGDPVEVADGVLREAAAPALHVGVPTGAAVRPTASRRSASDQ